MDQDRRQQAIDESIARGKRELEVDAANGVIPADVVCFNDLHDFVDANEYGGLTDDDWYLDVFSFDGKGLEACGEVQFALDRWIRAGGLRDDHAECPNGHGPQLVVEGGSTPGFTGMPIHWTNLACGCQLVDASADGPEAAR